MIIRPTLETPILREKPPNHSISEINVYSILRIDLRGRRRVRNCAPSRILDVLRIYKENESPSGLPNDGRNVTQLAHHLLSKTQQPLTSPAGTHSRPAPLFPAQGFLGPRPITRTTKAMELPLRLDPWRYCDSKETSRIFTQFLYLIIFWLNLLVLNLRTAVFLSSALRDHRKTDTARGQGRPPSLSVGWCLDAPEA